MLRKVVFLALFSLIIVSYAGGLPYVFKAGTPAKAQEVNENFSVLKNIACEIDGSTITNNLTYTPKNAAVGSIVNIGGNAFKLLKVPFFEYGSGDIYAVIFPRLNASFDLESGSGNSYTLLSTEKRTEDYTTDCASLAGGAFNVSVGYLVHGLSMHLAQNEAGAVDFIVNQRRETVDFEIYIGRTSLELDRSFGLDLNYQPYSKLISKYELQQGQFDYSTQADFSNYSLGERAKIIAMYDELLDYVRIEKVSP